VSAIKRGRALGDAFDIYRTSMREYQEGLAKNPKINLKEAAEIIRKDTETMIHVLTKLREKRIL